MLLVNTDYISGKELETLGVVKGNIVQTKNFGKDFMAGIKTLVGGEITQYTELIYQLLLLKSFLLVSLAVKVLYFRISQEMEWYF